MPPDAKQRYIQKRVQANPEVAAIRRAQRAIGPDDLSQLGIRRKRKPRPRIPNTAANRIPLLP